MATRTPEQKVDEVLELLRETHTAEQQQLSKTSADLNYIISAPEASGILGSVSLPVKLIHMSTMQLRAFLKPAKFSVDEAEKTVTVRYDSRSAFHYKQAFSKIDLIQDTLARASGGRYTLVLIDPQGEEHRVNDDLP